MTAHDPATTVACVLVEGTYFHGAAALINSLLRNGFRGTVLVGYRGALPDWARGALPPQAAIRFIPLDPGWHLTNLKARFLLAAMTQHCPQAATGWYFDADLVVMCPWSNFERWGAEAVLATLDIKDVFMPPSHVFRDAWRGLAARAGLPCRDVTGYVNAGFLGVPRAHLAFLRVWQRLLDQRAAEGTDMTRLVLRDATPEFAHADQDILNVAFMASTAPWRLLGVEAMGRFPYVGIMGHAMIFDKPWKRNHLKDALKGFQTDVPERAFWRYADGPIRSFSPGAWRRKAIARRLARWIGYIHRRSMLDW